MSLPQQFRKALLALSLVLVLTLTACGGAVATSPSGTQTKVSNSPQVKVSNRQGYGQVERGNTQAGQDLGDWVVQTGKGLVQDSYVRGGDKLGVVVSSQVRPNEVRPLAKSLVQGFRQKAPNRDLTVLMYAPDKKLILTAKYDNTTKQIQYEG